MNAPAVVQRKAGELAIAMREFRREFAWVGVYSLYVNLLMISPTLYMMQVFDRVMLSRSELTLLALSLIIVVFFAAMAFAEWVRSRLLVKAGVRFDEFLNARVFGATFEANLNQGRHNPVQSFTDLTSLRQFLTGNGVFAFFDTPWALLYIVVLFLIHPLLGWMAFGFLTLLLALALFSARITSPRHESAMKASVQSQTYLASRLRNAETVQSMGMLGNLRRQWLHIYERQIESQLHAQHVTHYVQAATKFVQYAQSSIVLATGCLLAVRGEVSVGSIIASNMLMSNALRPVGTLVSTWKQFIDARQAYGRLSALLDEHPERDAGHVAERVAGQMTLQNLVATAEGRSKPILKGLDAQFHAGEVVAIVGPSGAGKSTLARCLIGIWPRTEGEVLLDSRPVADWSREELGPHIGYLPQDIELFEGTIAENIARFGEVDSQKVVEAAQRTGIHEMILRLPNGYDTPMGVAGGRLSGGQRQRVGLARAIYGNPALVVLDEPNANLDEAGIAALVRTIRELKARGATTFFVAHDRNLLAVADRALALADGAITQFAQIVQTRTASA